MNSEKTPAKKRYAGIFIWAALHIALVVAVVLSYPWKIDRNLYSIVPQSEVSPEVQEADAVLSSRTSQQMMLFVGDSDIAVVKKSVEEIAQMLSENDQVESVQWKTSGSALSEWTAWIERNSLYMQDPQLFEQSAKSAAKFLYDKAASRLFGAFPVGGFSNIADDPYFLSASAGEWLLSKMPSAKGRVSVRDGMLAVQDSGKIYALISFALKPDASAFAADGHVLAQLDEKLHALQKAHPGFRYERSGIPFHSYESSGMAQKEVAWISGISLAVIVLLLLLVFRSAVPLVSILLSIAVAILAGTGATLAMFGGIHVFTFVFGTSVIGVSIDYALHHFADRDARIRSILLGFLTTELSYLALAIVDFPLLRQMALFSMVGLLSALLSVLLVFPSISREVKVQGSGLLSAFRGILKIYASWRRIPRWLRIGFYVAASAALVVGIAQVQVQTDIRAVYRPSDALGKSEIKIHQWMNSGISPNYYIVSGNSPEEVLVREEALTAKLRTAVKDSSLGSYLAMSDFFPSKARKEKLDSAYRKILPIRYAELCKLLGIKKEKNFVESMIARSAAAEFSLADSTLPKQFSSIAGMLWIGKIGERYFSAVLPMHASENFAKESFADPQQGIFWIDKMSEVNDALTELSRTALALVAFAYFAVIFVLFFVYTWKDSFRIVRAPILACLFTLAVFGYAGITVNFFAITGLILTLGLGIDYALFFKDSQKHADSTALAVALSAVTTLVSFGTLAFSGFLPISVFGLAVLLGIAACFLLSPFSMDRDSFYI